MEKLHVVSVRTLAEFACCTGSLTPAAMSAQRMREGREGHEALQSLLDSSWQPEAPISQDVEIEGLILRIQGRADALRILPERICINEIKTTRRDLQDVDADDHPEHWAQAEIYAYLFCRKHALAEVEITLTYAGVHGGKRVFAHRFDWSTLEARFLKYAVPYARWILAEEAWKDLSQPTLLGLQFPFDTFREGQREMAKYVYSAMVQGERTIIEAPTGIGKTAASLYGALKALGEGKITSVFYLTARTTGRNAAENALLLMRRKGLKARSVTLTAKEKICIREKKGECGMCPYADGYFDRRRDALKIAMQQEVFDAPAVLELAQRFELCPFELSLDLTEIADVVICDYNYVFDPRVRLKRHFDKKSRAGLLVDEAHNLPDRMREMYSAVLNGEEIEKLRGENALIFGTDDPLYHALGDLLDALTAEDAEYDALREVPQELVYAAADFAELAEKLQVSDEKTVELMLEASWFARCARQFDEESYRLLIRPAGQYIEAKLWCFAPEKYLDRAFSRVGGAAMFSATLTPIDFYARLLAVPDRNAWLTLESPFPPENLFAARIPVSVKFRDRADTLEQVARVIKAAADAHVGNYMACFPSHAYLTQVFQYYRMRFPDDRVIRQDARMSERRRAEFIAEFRPNPQKSLIAFVVLGGVFAEGVDLPDDLLSGAVIVSTGVPQVNPEAEMLRELYDDGMDGGYDTAYTYPGFRRVLQAAGRVIRTETDRGIVLLLDARYGAEKYLNLMPDHWHVHKITSMSALNRKLNEFWNE